MSASPAPKPFSIRMSEQTLKRLSAGARRRGEPKARTAERLIDEGLRMEDHPGIVFREGPAGRRAALAGGPDVWEVIEAVRGTGLAGEEAIAATAEWGGLTAAQVRLAVRYYGDRPARSTSPRFGPHRSGEIPAWQPTNKWSARDRARSAAGRHPRRRGEESAGLALTCSRPIVPVRAAA
jgi:hypothetical protein